MFGLGNLADTTINQIQCVNCQPSAPPVQSQSIISLIIEPTGLEASVQMVYSQFC